MKKSMKFVAAFVLMCLSLSVVTPKVTEAAFYNGVNGPIFATDSILRNDGSWCWAMSANFDCGLEVDQHVQLFSVIYYRNKVTGVGGFTAERSGSAYGVDPYVERDFDAPTAEHEIYLITSIHNGYLRGQRITENTRASR